MEEKVRDGEGRRRRLQAELVSSLLCGSFVRLLWPFLPRRNLLSLLYLLPAYLGR